MAGGEVLEQGDEGGPAAPDVEARASADASADASSGASADTSADTSADRATEAAPAIDGEPGSGSDPAAAGPRDVLQPVPPPGTARDRGGPQPGEPAADASGAGDETVLTLAEAARTVDLSERALRKHIHRGKLVSQRIVRNGREIAAVTVGALRAAYGELEMVPRATEGADRPELRSARELKQADALRRLRAQQRDAEARLARLRAILGMERTEKRELRRQMRFLAETLSRTESRLEAAQEELRALTLELGRARGRAEALERRSGTTEPADG